MQNEPTAAGPVTKLAGTIEFIPPPISAETNAAVWLSLRDKPDGLLWTPEEAALYEHTTRRLLMDSSIAAIHASEVQPEN